MTSQKKLSVLTVLLISGTFVSACAHRLPQNKTHDEKKSGWMVGARAAQTLDQEPSTSESEILREIRMEIHQEVAALHERRHGQRDKVLPSRLKKNERQAAKRTAASSPATTSRMPTAAQKKIVELANALFDQQKNTVQAVSLEFDSDSDPSSDFDPNSDFDSAAETMPMPTTARGEQQSAKTPVLTNPEFASGEIANSPDADVTFLPAGPLRSLDDLNTPDVDIAASAKETPLIFELPVTYNDRVKNWIKYFQTTGRSGFRRWLERSTRWLPYIEGELEKAGMPQDIMYVAMIESGFSPDAVSPAHAVGMWQFIRPTGNRYGLRTTAWLDERRDVYKSTRAAIRYMKDLYKMFGSWYLVAASYNMGESGVRRLIKKHGSNDFWELADLKALPTETTNYVPKILAAMLIAKAPALYGFRDLQFHLPLSFEYFMVPGGTDLYNLAAYLGVSGKYLQELNPELIKGSIPGHVRDHRIRIPKGAMATVAQYVKMQSTELSHEVATY